MFLEAIRNQAWILVLIFAVMTGIATFKNLKFKGGVSQSIGWSLIRGLIFFVLFYIPLFDQPRISDNLILPIAGVVFLVLGAILFAAGSKQLVKAELQGIKGIPKKIIKTGLYSIIRHPVNLGLMLIFSGWYLLWLGVYALYFLAAFLVVFVFETFWEERNLEKEFGDEYTDYKRHVGMFIPRIRLS
jgi:protein-S-isoprenylcysteine O-methyltransferase Ste14